MENNVHYSSFLGDIDHRHLTEEFLLIHLRIESPFGVVLLQLPDLPADIR